MDIYPNQSKHCNKCNTTKVINEFSKDKAKRDGFRNQCKSCVKEYQEKNKESKKEYNKEYYEQNSDKRKEYNKEFRVSNEVLLREYREKNKDKLKEYQKEYKKINKEAISTKQKEYNKLSKDKRKEYQKEYYVKNINKYKEYREINKEKRKEWYNNSKHIRQSYQNKWHKNRINSDQLYKLTKNIRSLIGSGFKNKKYNKQTKTSEILGCSYEEFKIHIEKQFLPDMNWENRSLWHLDHIIPVSLGKNEREIITLNHYTNFQPLWAIDNLKKGNKLW